MPRSGTLASTAFAGDRDHGAAVVPLAGASSAKCPPDNDTVTVIAVIATAASVAGIIGAIIVFGDPLAC